MAFEIPLDAAGGLRQRAGKITEALLAQAQAAFRSCAPHIKYDRDAPAAVALPLFRPVYMNHHALSLAPRIRPGGLVTASNYVFN